MALWLQENQRVVVKKFEVNKPNLKIEDGYSVATLSSSRKKGKDETGYLYSDWGFVRFVGKAHEYVSSNVQDGNVLVLEKAMWSKESYTNKDGERVYPKNPQLVVFSCHLYEKGASGNKESQVQEEDESEIPF